jgi:putative tryptophan/tyrosine transport system substrate-binding protein
VYSSLVRTDPRYAPLFDELRRAGFVVGQNLQVVDWEWRPELFVEHAAALAKAKVDALFCGAGNPAIRACQQATTTIPIVGITDDMVGSGGI